MIKMSERSRPWIMGGTTIAAIVGLAALILAIPDDGVPSRVREEIAQQPTLALRIASAMDLDPDGWSDHKFQAHWRGGLEVWIANGEEFVGGHPEYGTPDWPADDHRFDVDRQIVWRAWTRLKSDQADLHNLKLFERVGPAVPLPSTGDFPPPYGSYLPCVVAGAVWDPATNKCLWGHP